MNLFLSKGFHTFSAHIQTIYSFILGLSLVFAYAPFSLWWLPLLVFPLWFKQIQGINHKAAFKQGYAFAFGWFASGISWVHVAIDEFGGMPLVVSLLLMLLLCAYLALYPALACYLAAKLTTKKQLSLAIFAPLWMLCEYLRGNVLTGFPWLSLGYSQIEGPLSSFAPIVGETGINFILLILCVSLFSALSNQARKWHVGVIMTLSLVTYATNFITWHDTTSKSLKVALIQGNIEQSIKWQPEQEWPTMLKYLDLSRNNYDADIIVWPESAIPALEPTVQDYLDMVNRSANLNNSAIITGIISYDLNYYNSLVVTGNKTEDATMGDYSYMHANRYSKYHLLPIGEFVPFQELLRPIAPLFNLPQSSFARGGYIQDNLIAKGIHILPLICFEIAFPEQLAANFTSNTNMILTVSNDAWFGDSHGPHQHLEIAKMRALEFSRPVIRSTNTGITAIIDHEGKEVARAPQFEEYVLKADVNIVTGKTPYTYIAPIFNVFILFYLVLMFIKTNIYKRA